MVSTLTHQLKVWCTMKAKHLTWNRYPLLRWVDATWSRRFQNLPLALTSYSLQRIWPFCRSLSVLSPPQKGLTWENVFTRTSSISLSLYLLVWLFLYFCFMCLSSYSNLPRWRSKASGTTRVRNSPERYLRAVKELPTSMWMSSQDWREVIVPGHELCPPAASRIQCESSRVWAPGFLEAESRKGTRRKTVSPHEETPTPYPASRIILKREMINANDCTYIKCFTIST